MRTIRVALLVYLVLLAVAVSFPLGPARAPWKRHFLGDVKPAHLTALAQDVAVNVALFVPVGFLARLLLGARAGALLGTVAGAALLALGIETLQHVLLPWRYSSWVDVVTNTAGGTLGAALASLVLLANPPPEVEIGHC
jgi:hypothetical protein